MRRDRRRPGRRARQRGAIVIIAGCAAALLAGPLAGALVVAGWYLIGRLRPLLEARRLDAARDRQLPDAIELLVLLVEAGLTPVEAVADLADDGPEVLRAAFGAVALRGERGDDFATALDALRKELGPRANPLVDTLAAADRYGTPLAPALELLRREARMQRQRHAEADARRLPVRLAFPLVLCTLPAFALLGIAPALLAALGSIGDLGL
jgi:tight adherence protein C